MKREIIITKDGSTSIYIPEMDETYHSVHGAIQEAKHVFIKNGLGLFSKLELNVFEVGFGTGLNAFLSAQYAEEKVVRVNYHSIEAFPVEVRLVKKLNYSELIDYKIDVLNSIQSVKWEEEIAISKTFSLKKIEAKMQDYDIKKKYYDVVFFDAFGPRAQSEMWAIEILQKMYDCLVPNGKLVTYCAQGQFKRDLKSIGFIVENLPGPPGKREMTVATKL